MEQNFYKNADLSKYSADEISQFSFPKEQSLRQRIADLLIIHDPARSLFELQDIGNSYAPFAGIALTSGAFTYYYTGLVQKGKAIRMIEEAKMTPLQYWKPRVAAGGSLFMSLCLFRYYG